MVCLIEPHKFHNSPIAVSHNEIEDLGPKISTEQITTFVDDVEKECYEKPLMSSVRRWTRMAEDEKLHDIHSILQRPVRVANVELNSAFTSIALRFPDIIFQTSTNVVDKLNYFTYFRANVKIRLMFNATPFMSGRYWVFFAPFDHICNRSAQLPIYSNVTGYPGTEIDLASGAPVELKIPYCAPLSHYNLIDTHSNMGELYLIPLNAIQTGTTPVTNGADMSIFAWFEDIDLALPTSAPVTVPLVAQVKVEGEDNVETRPSQVLSSITNIASVATPLLGSWVKPIEWVARASSQVLSSFGWNKPVLMEPNSTYANIPGKGYTNVEGVDCSVKLAGMPDNSLTYDGGIFSTDVDEMDIKYVASKSCIFQQGINWDLTQSAGHRIYGTPVTPGLSFGIFPEVQPTTLAYVTSMFRYWRGGLKFRLTVAKTAFHTGRLRITYSPGVYTDSGAQVLDNAYNWVLDLSVSSEIEIEIPFVANVPWKETLVSNPLDPLFEQEKFSTGYLVVSILTELRRASDSVANNCPVNMWISGAEDISFAIPDFANYEVAEFPSLQTIEEEEEEDEVPLRAQIFNVTRPSVEHNEQLKNTSDKVFPMRMMDLTSAEELSMGEKITNLRQLIKRFSPITEVYSYPFHNGAAAALVGPIPLNNDDYLYNQVSIDPAYFGMRSDGTINEQTIELPQQRGDNGAISTGMFPATRVWPTTNPLHRVSYLYRFYRGGKRYKVVNEVTNNINYASAGWKPVDPTAGNANLWTNELTTATIVKARTPQPTFASRGFQIVENGVLEPPTLGTFTASQFNPEFEHVVYSDLNGIIEFEVPYYGQMPISLVGEGTLSSSDGPLVRRSKIYLRRSHDPRGLDQPIQRAHGQSVMLESNDVTALSGGLRTPMSGMSIYEAAADDFSFGYLVGAPSLRRVLNV